MAWEQRGESKHVYYTRTERQGQRRVRVYFGRGPLGEMAALQDASVRLNKEIARRELKS